MVKPSQIPTKISAISYRVQELETSLDEKLRKMDTSDYVQADSEDYIGLKESDLVQIVISYAKAGWRSAVDGKSLFIIRPEVEWKPLGEDVRVWLPGGTELRQAKETKN